MSVLTRSSLVVALAAATACRTVPGSQGPAAVARAEAAAREAIATERTRTAATLNARAVGVAPFSADPRDTTATILAYGLADLLSTDLARSAQLRVVERLRTDALLRELGLAQQAHVDSATAPRVGLLLGARRLVVGAVSTSGVTTTGGVPNGRMRLDTRVADVFTSQLRAAPSADASLDELFDAEKQLALRLFDELGVTLTPAERAAVEQRPTRNVGAFLAYSRGVRAEAAGDFRGARAQYQRASLLDPAFTGARIGAARAESVAEARADQRTNVSAAMRVAGAVHEGVNREITGPAAAPPRAADAAFPAQQLITLLITVSVP